MRVCTFCLLRLGLDGAFENSVSSEDEVPDSFSLCPTVFCGNSTSFISILFTAILFISIPLLTPNL